MRTLTKSTAVLALMWGALLPSFVAALADVKDYEFQLVQKEIKKGDGAIIAIRLMNKKSGKPVQTEAVIFARRIDMAPDAMQEMTSPVEQLPSIEPGVYRFKTDLTMEGRWRLSLGAKVQGEEGTIASQLVLTAVPLWRKRSLCYPQRQGAALRLHRAYQSV
jgi:YtkA-like protein